MAVKKEKKQILLWGLDVIINIGTIFILVLVIQKWLIAPFDVSGSSMCDTLNLIDGDCVNDYGEKIIINEATYLFNDPTRGDVVVFSTDNSDKFFVKRIIGLPGETIEIKNGYVYLTKKGSNKQERLREDYLNANNMGNTKQYFSDHTIFKVPEKHYFLLGDNRRASTDSRSCFETSIFEICNENPQLSYIHREKIRGKAEIVWWPIKNIRIIEDATYPSNSESLEEK